jgi:hypothetical protein
LKYMHDHQKRIPDLELRLRHFQNIFVRDTAKNTQILHHIWPPSMQSSR